MQTYSGRQFWPLDPKAEEVFILDIAHALSNQCRYAGHCLSFYSVAEHSVLLSEIVPPQYAKVALMHDAPEAYMVDLVRPVKKLMPLYDAAEDKIYQEIAIAFGLPPFIPAIVKEYDTRMLHDEREQNMMPSPHKWSYPGEPLGVKLRYYDPARARSAFLRRFGELFGSAALATPASTDVL